jgi:beta-lactamase regulating signal transducer with metallopeptidase domain/HEAT repeat protein
MSGVHALGWALVHFGWQGAAVAAVLAAALRAARRRAASERYALCVAALAAMVVLPIWTFATSGADGSRHAIGWTAPSTVTPADRPAAPDAAAPAGAPTGAAPAATDASRGAPAALDAGGVPRPSSAPNSLRAAVQRALPIVVLVWWTGVVLLSARLLGDWRTAHRLRRIAVRPAPASCIAFVASLAARLHIGRHVEVLESTWLRVPAVVGWLRPVVLVPASAVAGLAPRQLEMLLAHELAHVRRHDYLVNLLQAGIETVLFYHPAVWWVSRRTRAEREHCCDDIAVAVCGDRRLYAQTLVDLEELRAASGLAVAASGGALGERVRRLLAPSPAQPGSRWAVGALGVASALGIAVAMLFAPGVVPASRGAAPSLGERRAPVAEPADPAAPLAARWDWALHEARARGLDRFWIGYAIVPGAELFAGPVFSGHLGEGENALRGHDMTLTGRITHVGSRGDDGGWRFPGVRLAVASDPGAVALLFEIDAAHGDPTLLHAHIASLVYPVDLHGNGYFWLGTSADEPSAALVRTLERNARGLDAEVDLVGALGVHSSSALVVPRLIEVIESREHDDVRVEAAEWAGRHPQAESLATLARAARTDRSAELRREAAESVGEMRLAAAADTAIALARTLRDEDARREAVESLGGRDDARSLAALIDLARDDADPDIAREAAETLGERREPAAREALRELARSHPSHDVRREAVETLGEALAPDAAREVLREIALTNTSQDARREAVETLAQLPGGVGMQDVREMARRHPDPEVRREAVEELGHLLSTAEAVDELRRVAEEDPNVDVQREAVETLGERLEPRARELVVRLAREHPRTDVRREAVETMGRMLPAAAAARALARIAAEERDPDVVREAMETLAELADGAGVPVLVEIARTHADAEVRRQALRTLVDSDDPRARSFLDRALREP